MFASGIRDIYVYLVKNVRVEKNYEYASAFIIKKKRVTTRNIFLHELRNFLAITHPTYKSTTLVERAVNYQPISHKSMFRVVLDGRILNFLSIEQQKRRKSVLELYPSTPTPRSIIQALGQRQGSKKRSLASVGRVRSDHPRAFPSRAALCRGIALSGFTFLSTAN